MLFTITLIRFTLVTDSSNHTLHLLINLQQRMLYKQILVMICSFNIIPINYAFIRHYHYVFIALRVNSCPQLGRVSFKYGHIKLIRKTTVFAIFIVEFHFDDIWLEQNPSYVNCTSLLFDKLLLDIKMLSNVTVLGHRVFTFTWNLCFLCLGTNRYFSAHLFFLSASKNGCIMTNKALYFSFCPWKWLYFSL